MLFRQGYVSVLKSSLPYLVSLSSSRLSSPPWAGQLWRHSIFPSSSFCKALVRVCIFRSVWAQLSAIRTSFHSINIPLISPAASSMVSGRRMWSREE